MDVIKALHIIFVITWFAGLFYIVRLYIYDTEALKKPDPDRGILQAQFKIMEKKLWFIITWPSAVLTTIFGTWLLIAGEFWTYPWMWVKLALTAGLWGYHLWCGHILNRLAKDQFDFTSFQLRLINELATLFLFAIVFVVELQNRLNWWWGLGGIALLSLMLVMAIRAYRKRREKAAVK